MLKSLLLILASTAAFFLSIAPVSAELTSINPRGANSGEERCAAGRSCPDSGTYGNAQSLIGIFETEVGKGTFSRIDDSLDSAWKSAGGQPLMIRALARYAGDSSTVGIDAGTGFQSLTQTIGNNRVLVDLPSDYATDPRRNDFYTLPNGGGWSSIELAPGLPFAFILNDLTVGYKLSSNPLLAGYANSGKSFLDYMVTWQVNDVIPHFFIAWEDRDPRTNTASDHDYNDLVLEVLYAQPLLIPDTPVSHAPEPGALALLLLGFPIIFSLTRRRRSL